MNANKTPQICFPCGVMWCQCWNEVSGLSLPTSSSKQRFKGVLIITFLEQLTLVWDIHRLFWSVLIFGQIVFLRMISTVYWTCNFVPQEYQQPNHVIHALFIQIESFISCAYHIVYTQNELAIWDYSPRIPPYNRGSNAKKGPICSNVWLRSHRDTTSLTWHPPRSPWMPRRCWKRKRQIQGSSTRRGCHTSD